MVDSSDIDLTWLFCDKCQFEMEVEEETSSDVEEENLVLRMQNAGKLLYKIFYLSFANSILISAMAAFLASLDLIFSHMTNLSCSYKKTKTIRLDS